MLQTTHPAARAVIRGGENYPHICGEVLFFQMKEWVTVRASVFHLPETDALFYGFHIHEGTSCSGTDFSGTLGHDNPYEKLHPFHSGDMPPLLSCDGQAWLEFRTNRFCVKDIIGKTVVIHKNPDDFFTQPSGNAGEKIACGVIHKM